MQKYLKSFLFSYEMSTLWNLSVGKEHKEFWFYKEEHYYHIFKFAAGKP